MYMQRTTSRRTDFENILRNPRGRGAGGKALTDLVGGYQSVEDEIEETFGSVL